MSPADSGSPRAARRQERLQGPSNAREPAPPVPELLDNARPRLDSARPRLDSAPPQPDNVLLQLPANGPHNPGSVRLVRPVSAPRRVGRDL